MPIDPKNLVAAARLTFADEFATFRQWNGAEGWEVTGGPQWSGRVTASGTLPWNNELQWYVNPQAGSGLPNPFGIADGTLHITARPADAAVSALIAGQPFTSGIVTTQHDFAQTYGYFEMRAQMPAGQGLWPAFWLLPVDGSWPPELDVMEMLGHRTTTLHTTAHSRQSGSWQLSDTRYESTHATTVADMTTGFHTYGLDWGASELVWFFDGDVVHRTATPTDMHKPMYMVANLAVGGDLPGSPDAATTFPATMQIDYIRAYEAASTREGGSAERLNAVYRFFDTKTGDHFYTLDVAERDWIVGKLDHYDYEGVAWATPDKGLDTIDVHRFFDRADGSHFFTTSVAERDWVIASLAEHVYEGVAFQAYAAETAGAGRLTLDRFYDTARGVHHYTASASETASLKSGGAGESWLYESPGFTVHAPTAETLLLA